MYWQFDLHQKYSIHIIPHRSNHQQSQQYFECILHFNPKKKNEKKSTGVYKQFIDVTDTHNISMQQRGILARYMVCSTFMHWKCNELHTRAHSSHHIQMVLKRQKVSMDYWTRWIKQNSVYKFMYNVFLCVFRSANHDKLNPLVLVERHCCSYRLQPAWCLRCCWWIDLHVQRVQLLL